MVERKITWPQAGEYVVAVSGGVDSMVLLDILATAPSRRGYILVVAHFDHAMRAESAADAAFVAEAARGYGAQFVTARAALPLTSEAQARTARHAFFHDVLRGHPNHRLVTAHHQDDLIETSLLNLTRGTGWEGMAPFNKGDIVRPLLPVSKVQIVAYAKHHHLWWHEDPSNADRGNPRNFLRHELLPYADKAWRRQYLALIGEVNAAGMTAQKLAAGVGHGTDGAWVLSRTAARELSLHSLEEVIVYRAKLLNPTIELDRRLVQELALFAKTGRPGTARPVRADMQLKIGREEISLCSVVTAQNVGK
jgi:tRNA(Ile)-lysidine synthetase-like protein